MNTSEFLNEAIEVEKEIDEITSYIRQVQTIQTKRLIATSAQQEATLSQERDQLTDILIKLLTKTKDRIRKIESENINLRKDDQPDILLRENRHAVLKSKFQKALDTYRDIEDSYMQQQKDKIIRQYRLVNSEATEEEIENYLQNPSNSIFLQTSTGSREAKAALAEVQKRHGDIQHIEKTITELLKLFDEIRLHVEESDPKIQEVETVIEQNAMDLEKANDVLEVANVEAKSARNKKWICFSVTLVLVVILIMILIFIVVPTKH
ncbi:6200_t:CDS:1 [Cetraspora pellucida]|uniref:6200_t:CDS:1 n=1 Tax=Cetraspora pellucida TaxID=1433469 RepID=A0ACA9PQ04_9GLOM|nr:6200_t:CDS:1 [Cetraspora pellucida]